MAMFPFTGWDDSFYGDLHIREGSSPVLHPAKVVSTAGSARVEDVWKK
jgi:hypothetical protein